MIRYPSRPEDGRTAFEARAAPHRVAVAALVREDGTPDIARIGAYIEQNEIWQTGVKDAYFAHQDQRCAYCERMVTDYGDVEHYRPKNAAYLVDPEHLGEELESLNNVRGRRFLEPPTPGTHASGYWWLAYEWSNYMATCQICNRIWKNAAFPIEGGHLTAPEPGQEATEAPLVLDPYGTDDPAEHLAFDELGAVEAFGGSVRGRATIDVLGLDRPSVRRSRKEKAEGTWFLLARIEQAVDGGDLDAVRERLADLARLGAADTVHAGMVRCIATQKLGIPWEEVEAGGGF
ncbi:MAG: hypothetical protein KC656_03235 [Myxococcales bacterium]|nr:hypothetical protein [Myxococcales bacterium]MCB9669613.1 hypothetical protein [Alphaproteobacteria bacterium]